jgi:osmotically-inducible protein OsmY
MAKLIARRRSRARHAPWGAAAAALLAACGVGAIAEYLLDPQHGARRRHMARDRALAAMRRRKREAVRQAKYYEGVAEGVAHRAAHAVPGVGSHHEEPDDVTLAQKVESIAFRQAHVPKDHVSVNAEDGVVHLRGRLDSQDQIEELVRAAAAVEGVKSVRNLLHTPQ